MRSYELSLDKQIEENLVSLTESGKELELYAIRLQLIKFNDQINYIDIPIDRIRKNLETGILFCEAILGGSKYATACLSYKNLALIYFDKFQLIGIDQKIFSSSKQGKYEIDLSETKETPYIFSIYFRTKNAKAIKDKQTTKEENNYHYLINDKELDRTIKGEKEDKVKEEETNKEEERRRKKKKK